METTVLCDKAAAPGPSHGHMLRPLLKKRPLHAMNERPVSNTTYLEGQGDVVSRSIRGITRVPIWVTRVINLITRSPKPPSRMNQKVLYSLRNQQLRKAISALKASMAGKFLPGLLKSYAPLRIWQDACA